jgi:hypothetical protein
MSESYNALPYKMRNDAAWMVCEDRTNRVVLLRLSEQNARTLAATLNVADLAAEVTDYGDRRPAYRRPRASARRTSVRKSLP